MQSKTFQNILILGLILCAVLYTAGLNTHWRRLHSDGPVYLSLARSLVEGKGYEHNYAPHGKYAPGLPVILAGVETITWVPQTLHSNFLPLNITLSLFGFGSIILAYLILAQLRLKRTHLLACLLLFGLSRSLYFYSTHIMTDVPFTFFALATLYCGLRMIRSSDLSSWGWAVGAAALAVVASGVRQVGIFLLPSLLLGLWIRSGALKQWKQNIGKTITMISVPLLPLAFWALRTTQAAQAGGRSYFRGYFSNIIERIHQLLTVPFIEYGDNAGTLTDLVFGSDVGPIIGTILIAVMLFGLVEIIRRREVLLSSYAVINIGVIFAGGWTLKERYMLPVLLVLCLWLVLGARRIGLLMRRKIDYWTKKKIAYAGWILLALVVVTNLIRIGKVIYQQRHPDFYHMEDVERLSDYDGICQWLRDNADPMDTTAAHEHRVVHYFSRVKTYELHSGRGRRSAKWMAETIQRKGIRYIVQDEREQEATAFLDDLRDYKNLQLKAVQKDGRVTLWQVEFQ